MTFTQINYFLELARALNYTNAAANLFITQSTLSRSIASLENEIGVKLFERDYHTVKLTAAGEVMYTEMQTNMECIAKTLIKVQEIANRPDEKIRVGILEGQGIEACILFGIKDMAETYPDLAIEIKKSDYFDLIAGLKSGKLDFVLTVQNAEERCEGLECLTFHDLKQYFFATETDPIWDGELTMERIAQRTIIMPSKFYPGNQDILDRLKQFNESPSVIHAEDMETHRVFLETGMGVTFVNDSSVIYGSRSDTPLRSVCVPDKVALPKLKLSLVWRKESVTSFMEAFLDRVKEAQERLTIHPQPKRGE